MISAATASCPRSSELGVGALRGSRRRGMLAIVRAGSDGGPTTRESALDRCVTVRASSVHRIGKTKTIAGPVRQDRARATLEV